MFGTSEYALSRIKEGTCVLDLGAGVGKQAKLFADKGAVVDAVDIYRPYEIPEGVRFHTMRIDEYLSALPKNVQYDVVCMRNVLHYLRKECALKTILPMVQDRVADGGVVVIQTFTAPPEPPFSKEPGDDEQSYYRKEEFEELFSEWTIVNSKERKSTHSDMNGAKRLFSLTNFIAEKPRS